MRKLRILFFTPYTDFTGSEIFLLNLFKLLYENGVELALVSRYKGNLYNEFSKFASVYNIDREAKSTTTKILRKARSLVSDVSKLNDKEIEIIHKRHQPDLWYVNTMAFPEIYPLANKLKVKIVTHFHELPFQYTTILAEELHQIISMSQCLVGCSEAVTTTLKSMGAKNIFLQYEAIDPERIKITRNASEIRKELGFAKEDFVVLMSGLRTYRKGLDLFTEVAEKLKGKGIEFLWIGKDLGDGFHYFVQQKIKNDNIGNITFVDEKKYDYFNYAQVADLFFLSSREDPFPLTMIEAGMIGKPIVAFSSGGAGEFIKDFNGKYISGFDTLKLSSAILEMKDKQYDADKIKEHAMQYSIQNQLPKLYSTIKNLINLDKKRI